MPALHASGTTLGTIMAYDSASDTCIVEFTGAGVLDLWIRGVKLSSSINRAYAVQGAVCTIDVPDPLHLGQATITAISVQVSTTVANTSGTVITQTGSGILSTDVNGTMGLQPISFPRPFSAAPTVYAGGPYSWSISSITTTRFNVTLAGSGPFTPNTGYLITWSAEGQA